MEHTLTKTTLLHTVKARTLAVLIAVAAAVALPQAFHLLGAATGLGAGIAKTLLPMHLPVLLVGLIAGPAAGLAAGILSPIVSFALTQMPAAAVLPFMTIEVAGYGMAAGLLSARRGAWIGKLLLAQLAGRAARAAAVLIAVYGLGSQAVRVSSIWADAAAGLPGLVLQWAAIPLIMLCLDRLDSREA